MRSPTPSIPRPLFDAAMDLVEQGGQENDWLVLHVGGAAPQSVLKLADSPYIDPDLLTKKGVEPVDPTVCSLIWSPSSGRTLVYADMRMENWEGSEPDAAILYFSPELVDLALDFAAFTKRDSGLLDFCELTLGNAVMDPDECLSPESLDGWDFRGRIYECVISRSKALGVHLRGSVLEKYSPGCAISEEVSLELLQLRPGDRVDGRIIEHVPVSLARHVGCSYAVLRVAATGGDEDVLRGLVRRYVDAGQSLDNEIAYLRDFHGEPEAGRLLSIVARDNLKNALNEGMEP